MSEFGLTKAERLHSKVRIDKLFTQGESFVVYPYRVVFICRKKENDVPISLLISVPRKRFKRAVKRNLIRRRVKETYRLNKHLLSDNVPQGMTIDMAILYIDKEVCVYAVLEKKMKELLNKLKDKLVSDGIQIGKGEV
ncbi:ribonuclease P protein component [Coprobacter tertius]|uniref:Ribonuclease P protein component n=1 Tax=Coprobacter tertius TaxID=2944915 RepID=A0ABT1MIL2_9BACT|nr:ribonuclease P protein component [Coprobacter tertius]MCP9612450.1 ribonuclease P protein component [Coprobacter tertius]